jgi:hypothetical protein
MASSNSEECLTLGKQITVNCWNFLFKTCLCYAPDDCLKNMLCVGTILINALFQTCLWLTVTWHQRGWTSRPQQATNYRIPKTLCRLATELLAVQVVALYCCKNTYSSSPLFKFSKNGVRICTMYSTQFPASKQENKKFLSNQWHSMPLL